VLSVPNDVLNEMYETSRAVTHDGRQVGLNSVVAPEFANALYALVRREKPRLVLEVGLAQGATALTIATGLRENGEGRLISIDPFQRTEWHGAGLHALERAGLEHLHTHLEDPDFIALPRLLETYAGAVDLAYIDGRHSFEYALLDFFYVDRLLRVGGLVGFNDCDWPAIIPTLRFVRDHRRYVQVDVGLKPAYGNRNRLARWYARAETRFVPRNVRLSRLRAFGRLMGRRREDRYFSKLEAWEPREGWMPRRPTQTLKRMFSTSPSLTT
jgi:predicted O-methyltransferase YrrM